MGKRQPLYLLCLLVIFSLKMFLFYSLVGQGHHIWLTSLISLYYLVIVLYISKIIFKEKYHISFTIFYILTGFLMLIDLVYLKYTNNYTSVGIIGQAKQTLAVAGSIKDLFSFKYLLLIVDIPIIGVILTLENKYLRGQKKVEKTNKRIKAAKIVIACLLPIFILVNPINNDIVAGIRTGEFFSYHAFDIGQQLLLGDKPRTQGEGSPIITIKDKEGNYNSMLFGAAKGKNLIVIQVESLQAFAINRQYEGQEITPNLNKLIKDKGSLYFDNYYQQIGRGNTSDAEFVSQNSLYPTIYGQAYTEYQDNYFYGLPWVMKENKYSTVALHGYKKEFWNRSNAYKNQGFDNFISEENFTVKEKIGLGITDEEFFDQSLNYLKKQKRPFYSFLITLSSHSPYDMPSKYNKLAIKESHKGTAFAKYINAVSYTDNAIGEFIEGLKKEGLYDNSIIAIYGDHFGLLTKDADTHKIMTEILGYSYEYDEMMKIPLIVHIPGKDVNKTIDTLGSQLDFAPTILNLMGIKRPDLVMLGQDIVNAEHGFVATQTQMLKGSFIQDDIVFEISRDGVYNNSKAYNKKTRESVDIAECRTNYEKAISELDKSNYILENDIIKQVMINNKGIGAAEIKKKAMVPESLIAHAGGKIGDETYTNCQEALDTNYSKGFRLFELDFEWTSDNKPVALHSWDGYIKRFFKEVPKQYTYNEFMDFKMINNWHQLDLEKLSIWLKSHPDAFIVTDVKENNVELLKIISENYKDVQDQFIPQIYQMDEYIKVEYMGYKNIIYTLYLSKNTDDEIIDFVKRNKLFAVTMSIYKAKTGLLQRLEESGVFIYTHTINSEESQKDLEQVGIDGFYTDSLPVKK